MNNQIEFDEPFKKIIVSQPSSRKSRSISRYFLGNKRSSVDNLTQHNEIHRCLTSIGIFDSYDLWTNVTLFRDYTTNRRLLILTNKNELIIGKCNQRQTLFKIKHRIDLNRIWLYTNINDSIASEITSLNYYDYQRSLIIGWPLAENFIVEFDTKATQEIWKERIESTLRFWWQLNSSNIEHVRIVIDQNYESDQNNNTASFLIRKVIGIRPEETVRDLIKKCIDSFHLRDPLVDNYVLFVTNNHSNGTNLLTNNVPSASQSTQITNMPLIGHEYPYSIKMKHLKTTNSTHTNNRSFDGDDHLTFQPSHNNSSSSLNNVTTTNYHDFELRKRDTLSDNQTKKHRFFYKRKTKTQQQLADDHHSSSTPYLSSPNRTKTNSYFFGQTLEELLSKHNQQLPPIIMQLLEILYVKGPETTGIFRKVANTRSVKDCIDKIERNISLQDDDLHPILAAGLFKHFLRTLPDPVFNSIQYDNWKKCLRLPSLAEKISFARRSILATLSEANHILLKGFICILYRISHSADSNGMNPFNLGLCVSNSLFKTESTTITSGKQEADVMSSIVEFLIQNCSSLFGSDVITCISDKRIIVHQIPNLTRPTISSIESLDEVESSPHLPVINRSHDSGLAASDQPFNDDSSEISEKVRRRITAPVPSPDWTSSIACGKGIVLTSIIIPAITNNNANSTVTTVSVIRRRSSKNPYKPSKQFLEREKLTNDTTDESDHNSSIRSSATTIHNLTIGKIKRSKSLSRHSSLGSGEHKQQKQITKESKRSITNDVKRTSSLKQFHRISDEGDDDDEQNNTLNDNTLKKILITNKNNELYSNKNLTKERRTKSVKSKTNISNKKNDDDDECMTTRSNQLNEQQVLDLTTESLSTINQRLMNSIPTRSASFTLTTTTNKSDLPVSQTSSPCQQPIIADSRSRHNGPSISPYPHLGQSNLNTPKPITTATTERGRTFVHNSDSRPFMLSTAIQMKPIDDNDKRRPCHRQNALRYKCIEQDRQSRIPTPVIINHNPAVTISRYQSIERRITPTSQPIKSYSFDINNDLQSSDISWSVREKTKIFEHPNLHKLSTGRENYV